MSTSQQRDRTSGQCGRVHEPPRPGSRQVQAPTACALASGAIFGPRPDARKAGAVDENHGEGSREVERLISLFMGLTYFVSDILLFIGNISW